MAAITRPSDRSHRDAPSATRGVELILMLATLGLCWLALSLSGLSVLRSVATGLFGA